VLAGGFFGRMVDEKCLNQGVSLVPRARLSIHTPAGNRRKAGIHFNP